MASAPVPSPAQSLMVAAQVAQRAPSVFNTQPWRWRVGADLLELHADRSRRLVVADPDGRLLTISCGAALHHARVALAAAGHRVAVERLPDPARPGLLARVRLAGFHEPDLATLALREAIDRRRTDRRAFGDRPVPPTVIDRLRAAAEEEGGSLHIVREDQMPMLACAVASAAERELADPAYRSELIRWTNRPVRSGDGVPVATAVRAAPRRVPAREFALGVAPAMDAGSGTDRGAVFAILFGDSDEPIGWLRGGEALSAVLLTATAAGLSAGPSSDVMEVGSTRELLRGLIARVGYPYLVLRFGTKAAAADVPAAPRRDPADVIDETD
ncbi:MAG TPA: nitroreductase [Micromonosporaceae bacterium]|jgi:nitroreductase